MITRTRSRLLALAAVTLLLIGGFLSYPSASGFAYPTLPSSRFFDWGGAEPKANILLVSAFFPLAKSKHSIEEYESWFTKFIQPIETDLYFFCPPAVEPLIRRLRGDKHIIIDTTYHDPQDVPPLKDYRDIYQEMHAWDKEKSYHGPGLYAVWNAKPFFLEKGLALAETHSNVTYDYAFWQDAGAMRDAHTYKRWPSAARVVGAFRAASQSSGTPEDELIFFPWWWTPKNEFGTWKESDGPMDDTIAEGSFFGGRHRAIHDYATTYYAYHDRWLAQGLFVGKDQMLMNSLVTLFPKHFFGVLLYDYESPERFFIGGSDQVNSPIGACGSTWWYFQWWLADLDEREPTADMWLGPNPSENDLLHERPKGSSRCRDTYIIVAYDLIRRSFGKDWSLRQTSLSWGQKNA